MIFGGFFGVFGNGWVGCLLEIWVVGCLCGLGVMGVGMM